MENRVQISGVPDRRDPNGAWLYCWTEGRQPAVQHRTRASIVWRNILSRCKAGGAHQVRRATYLGCKNGFADFQHFAEWAQTQFGYTRREQNGMFWQLDKDILAQGQKVYSPETCLFVPARVNLLMAHSETCQGALPVGVSKTGAKYRATIRYDGSASHLGVFRSPDEAHAAWRLAKAGIINELIDSQELRGHDRLIEALANISKSLREPEPCKPSN